MSSISTPQTPTVTLPHQEVVDLARPLSRTAPVRGLFVLYDNSKLFLEPTENVTSSDLGEVGRRPVMTTSLQGVDTASLSRPLTFTMPNPEVSQACYKLVGKGGGVD